MISRKEIASRIVTKRIACGLTQEELIDRIGDDKMSLSTLKRIESGKGNMKFMNIVLICEALDDKLVDVLSENDKENAIRDFYQDDDDSCYEEEIRHILLRQELFYPEVPDNSIIYSRYRITNLMQFIIYLPLMDPVKLFAVLDRICGETFEKEAYVLDKLDWLYEDIPKGNEKAYADLLASECTYKEFMRAYTTGTSIQSDFLCDENGFIEEKQDLFVGMRKAYWARIRNRLDELDAKNSIYDKK